MKTMSPLKQIWMKCSKLKKLIFRNKEQVIWNSWRLSKKHSKKISAFGLRPLTRDGAIYLIHSHHLWGVTDQGVLSHNTRDWDDIYD
jgi:hypothetical protein